MRSYEFTTRTDLGQPQYLFWQPMYPWHSDLGFANSRFVGKQHDDCRNLSDYPHLVIQDIYACIAYGAEISHKRFVETPFEKVNQDQQRIL